jgi:2-iminobutanoate/2-iminopropanoate deaminase
MTIKTRIETPLAPPPMPVFSQGVRMGAMLAVSGQGGVDPATGTYPSLDDVGAQTTQTLRNLVAILEAAGSSLDDVIMLRCYLTTRDHFPAMNAAYTVFVGLPLPEMLVEIDAIAVVAD